MTEPSSDTGRAAPDPHAPGAAPERGGWRRLAGPRRTRSNVLILLLAVGLGFAISTQVRQTRTGGLESLTEQELVGVLDTVTQEGVRLGNELRDLQRTQDRLASGAGAEAEALRVARERAETFAILAGTAPATGPGIAMTIHDPAGKVTSTVLLDALQELRDAGAEVVQIGPVRVVAGTYFTDTDAGVTVTGTLVEPPYTVLAIGDPPTMAAAMEIPGGVVETVRGLDGEVAVLTEDEVAIEAVVAAGEPQFATPVPTGTPSTGS